MKVFANREIRILFRTVLAVWAVALALTQGIVWHTTHVFSFGLLLVFLLLGGCLWGVLFRYFQRQSALLEQAVQQIQSCLDGNPDARLDCDREGEFYRLFHSVNALAAVLSAHADNEQREKRFLKNTIADISHQLKTPLAALNIYNGLLQDEVVSVMYVPQTVTLSRRLAFRYVKIELLGSSPYYDFNIHDMKCMAQTSAKNIPEELPQAVDPMIRKIDRVGLNTLKECMQTVYEDGPKRDQRLWIGDLYLEALGNNYSYKQHDLTKRCLYLLAGLSDLNGYLLATVIENPVPRAQDKQFLYEYALLYNVTLKDYLEATGDMETVKDLWPVAKKQLDIVRTNVKANGLMDFEKVKKDWWVFFDWKEDLYKEVPLQGVSIFALKESYKLAQLLGKEKEVADLPALTNKMIKAARKNLYNRKTGLFVGTGDKQISYASQIWMILSGVASKAEGKKALSALTTTQDVCYPGTPYMYHYYIQSLIDCGMNLEAKEALVNYWGGMIAKGADTFWEAYDPTNDFISPYDFYPINSYCHAWSCTPVY